MFSLIKKIKPSADEISTNPRSRSAKINVWRNNNESYIFFLLIILITVSAFSVVFIKYQNRTLNIDISENEKRLFILSESYRNISRIKIEITDRTIQKNSLGKALNMQLP